MLTSPGSQRCLVAHLNVRGWSDGLTFGLTEFWHSKNLLVITRQSFLLAKKTHIVSYFGQSKCFQHQTWVNCSWSHPEALCQIWCKLAYRWHYNGCKCIFAFNFHILKNTFINIIFMYFPNRARFSNIGPADFSYFSFIISPHTK